MLRTQITISVVLLATALFAQEPAMRVDKSAPIEMQADPSKTVTSTPIPEKNVVVSGDPDLAPAPAACKEKAAQERLDCLSREVLGAIRAKLSESDAGIGSHANPVVINFTVNEYGEMEGIKVDNASSTDLPKKIIVALYALPTFAPAEKGGKTIGTKVTVTYPYDALFPPK